jgi:4-amino-4-deoxy-L-arabinose transferase-like glycosyltransferase
MDIKALSSLGLLILIESYLAFFLLKKRNQDKIGVILFWLLLCCVLLRVLPSLDNFLHRWDESYHALVAKNLGNNMLLPILYPEPVLAYDYRDWAGNYVWMHKPPLALWCMASAIKCLGSYPFVVRLPSILFSTLTLLCVFRIGLLLYNLNIAIIASLFFCFNGFIIDLCSGRTATDHIDTAFIFFVAFGIYHALLDTCPKPDARLKRSILIGLVCGAAVLTKWILGFFILAYYAFLLFSSGLGTKRSLLKLCIATIVSIAVALPWNLYAYMRFPDEFIHEQVYNLMHINQSLEGQGKPFWYFLDVARIHWNELIYLHFLIFLYYLCKKKHKSDINTLAWILPVLLIFSLFKTKMPAYVAIASPAFFLMMASAITHVSHLKAQKALLIISIILSIRYSIERINPREIPKQREEPNISHYVQQYKDKKLLLIGYNLHIEAMFKYDLLATDKYPDVEGVRRLKEKGLTLIAFRLSDMPEHIRLDSSIVKW